MLGIIIPILITYYVYKNAKQNGRNAVLWAVINVVVIIAVQLLVGIIGIAVLAATDNSFSADTFSSFNGVGILINLVSVAASLIASYFIYRYVSSVPADKQFVAPPPPPQF